MYLNLKSGYSFRSVFAHIPEIVEHVKPSGFAGIADLNNTYAFTEFEKECNKAEIKPFYGVTLAVVPDLEEKDRRGFLNHMSFVALTQEGIKSIFRLTEIAYNNFYYVPRLNYENVSALNKNNVLVISGYSPQEKIKGMYQQVSPGTPRRNPKLTPLACVDNNYIHASDKAVYEAFADTRLTERKIFPQHIISHEEHLKLCDSKHAIQNLLLIAKKAERVKLQKAPMLKSIDNEDIEKLCKSGAKERGLNIKKGKYAKRYKHELKIIKEKDFVDYFLIVADLVKYAKQRMVVGSGRGSSGGSLICYLLGITEIDPLKYDLLFERFIDVNRMDFPDIDIDFQDDKIKMILQYLERKYGRSKVAKIANISKVTPRDNFNRTAKALFVPEYELEEVKGLCSDQKANALTVEKILYETEAGTQFLKKYPRMRVCKRIENHPSHSSIHAAGIIVCNDDISNYCGIQLDTKSNLKNKPRIAMLNMEGAEYQNLLKIDALSLKNLSIIDGVLQQIKKNTAWLYSIKDGDKKTYKLINKGKLTGVFQAEGRTVERLMSQIKCKSVSDLSAISALGRPGPLQAGVDKKFIKRKKGIEEVVYPDPHKKIKKILKPTFGIIIYQEQIMQIARDYAGMQPKDVTALRKVIAKSKGSEELQKFREKFVKGAKGKSPEKVWDMMKNFGSYGFVKAHSVAYGHISFLTAYMKAHYPLEFTVSLLNCTSNDIQALKMLRYIYETEGIEHIPFDVENSLLEWSVYKRKILGGLTSIDGIGIQNARKIIKLRETGENLPPGIQKHVNAGITPFRYLYPRKDLYFDYPGTNICEIKEKGEYEIVAQLIKKKLKDSNSPENVKRRAKDDFDGYLEPPTTYLNIIVADDTGEIMCIINRFAYEQIGKEIADNGKEEKSWYHIQGTFDKRFGLLFINDIDEITR